MKEKKENEPLKVSGQKELLDTLTSERDKRILKLIENEEDKHPFILLTYSDSNAAIASVRGHHADLLAILMKFCIQDEPIKELVFEVVHKLESILPTKELKDLKLKAITRQIINGLDGLDADKIKQILFKDDERKRE